MSFKVGQRAICIAKGFTNTWIGDDGKKYSGPRYNEIVTVSDIKGIELFFSEYPDDSKEGYNNIHFKPLQDNEAFVEEVLAKAIKEAQIEELELEII